MALELFHQFPLLRGFYWISRRHPSTDERSFGRPQPPSRSLRVFLKRCGLSQTRNLRWRGIFNSAVATQEVASPGENDAERPAFDISQYLPTMLL